MARKECSQLLLEGTLEEDWIFGCHGWAQAKRHMASPVVYWSWSMLMGAVSAGCEACEHNFTSRLVKAEAAEAIAICCQDSSRRYHRAAWQAENAKLSFFAMTWGFCELSNGQKTAT